MTYYIVGVERREKYSVYHCVRDDLDAGQRAVAKVVTRKLYHIGDLVDIAYSRKYGKTYIVERAK